MDQAAEIREKVDIVGLISEYTPLKKAGRNFKARCPFHTEKTPSFVVSPDRQVWHCFGCSKGGDAYTFLMDIEHMEFPEALRFLAKRVGVTLIEARGQAQITSKKERLYKVNYYAAEFYHYLLTKHTAGKNALSYLKERGVSPRTIETFRIGFAPNIQGALATYLTKKKGFTSEDLYDAGIAYRRGNVLSDFFRSRLIFPLIDHRDNVVGFSGRVLVENDEGPKYINTRETLVYHKGEMFFGMHIARETMRKNDQAIVVEGEFDVIACFQEGLSNTVALKGTALTESQVMLLARFAKAVLLCLDQDNAGHNAMIRSLPLLEKYNLLTSVVRVQEGKDPAEAIQKDPFAFKQAVKNAVPVYDFLLEDAEKQNDLVTIEGKRVVSEQLLPLFSQIQNEIVKEHYIKKLSSLLDTTYESLQKELTKTTRVGLRREEATLQASPAKKNREEVLEEYLLALILQSGAPKEALEKTVEVLTGSISKERAYQKILHHLLDFMHINELFDEAQFTHFLPTELLDAYNKCFLFPLSSFGETEQYLLEIGKVAKELRTMYLRDELKKVAKEISKKEKEGADTTELQQRYAELASRLTTSDSTLAS